MSKLQQVLRTAQGVMRSNSPLILTSVASAGVLATAVSSVQASLRSSEKLREAEESLHVDAEGTPYVAVDQLELKDRFKLVWTNYIPPVAIGAATIACVIGAHNTNMRRNAALVTAYSVADNALKEYKAKVIEQFGETKERKVVDAVAQDAVTANPVSNNTVIITPGGEVLCYESLSGRYFRSDMETMRKAQNDFNTYLLNDMYASLNSFWGLLGIPPTSMGEELGWCVDNLLELQFSTILSEEGKPCLVMGYSVTPKAEYMSFR